MRQRMNNILIAVLCFMCSTAFAQERVEAPFKGGESLKYIISYRAALFPNTEMAQVTINTSETTIDDKEAYRIDANAKLYSVFSWFYHLDDTYNVWIGRDDLRPIRHISHLEEGEVYKFDTQFDYNWDDMRVDTKFKNHRMTEFEHKQMPLTKESYDAISLFFNLRTKDVDNFTKGEQMPLSLVLEDTVRCINYCYLGREEKRISGIGKFKTLKFSCQLAMSNGETLQDGSVFYLWISDDKNKIPLYISSPIRVGSIRVKIVEYSNLKYPLTSLIK